MEAYEDDYSFYFSVFSAYFATVMYSYVIKKKQQQTKYAISKYCFKNQATFLVSVF